MATPASRFLRLLDADLNRAREAARCAEDYARFIAGRPAEAAALKAVRQDLGQMSRALPFAASRDVGGDALKDLTPATERRRAGPEAVATAALKRLQEALRSLEEFGKLLSPAFSRRAKRLRFEAYRIETLLLAHPMARALAAARLYAVLSPALMPGDPYRGAAAALRGGIDVLQLRAKGPGWPDRAVIRLAHRLMPLCRRAGVPFFLNDRTDLALACGADGVHVGQGDLTPGEVRAQVGRRLLLGVSTHSVPQIRTACRADIDYLAVGPVLPTLTKPHRGATGLALLKAVPKHALPAFAIGGIERGNLSRVLAAGARRVAVTGAIFRAVDIAAAARALKRALGRA